MMLKEDIRKLVRAQCEELVAYEEGTRREIQAGPKTNFAVVLSGVRRCGKSTLMRQVMKKEGNFYYFNFEDSRAAGFEVQDFQKLNEVFAEERGGAGSYFFDEIQNVEGWELFVRSMLDRRKRFLITGSNASLLSRELGTRLTGRHLKRELFPFSYREFLDYSSKSPSEASFRQYLLKGGFPEYLKTGNDEVLRELFNDVITRDIVVRHGLRNQRILKEMALHLVANVGNEFSYNKLAKTFSLGSANSAAAYLSYLEDSYLMFEAPKFDYSVRKQIVNPKKIYAVDNGMCTANSLSFSSDLGRMLENHVFLELRRRGKGVYYYKGRGECDFLVRDGNAITEAMQVCYELTEDNMARELGGLVEALEKFKLRRGLVVTYDQEDEFKMGERVVNAVPAWKWSAQGSRMVNDS